LSYFLSALTPSDLVTKRLNCQKEAFHKKTLKKIDLTHNKHEINIEWLACWTHVQKGMGSNRSQTVHAHCASVHQAAKLVAALLRVAGVTAGLAEPGL